MTIKVAVIGMGPLGLMAMKNFKEDGFEVHGFERRNWVGGLWKQSYDTSISTVPNTVFNSSRFRSAISDYPFPEHVEDFPTAKQIWQYLENYCDHFELRSSIRFNSDVKTFRREQGKWAVEYVQNGTTFTDHFDRIAVAPGSFTTARSPELKDVNKFQGKIIHSINFPDASAFQGHNVLLIGFHATAQDLVVELSPHAKKVYVSHRNGVVMISRYNPDGTSFDQSQNLGAFFLQHFMSKWFPQTWDWIVDKLLLSMSKKAWPNQPKEWNLGSAPTVAVSPPMIADAVYPFLENGYAELVPGVKQIVGPKTIQMADGRLLEDVDTIIYATGYVAGVACAPKEYNPYPVNTDAAYLYRGLFPFHPDRDVRNSLVFLGQGAIFYPGFIQFELTIWAVSQIFSGKQQLPPLHDMLQWYQNHLIWRDSVERRPYVKKSNGRLLSFILDFSDQMTWLDRTGGTGIFSHFSWFSWRSWRFWWQDPKFYKLCKAGLFTPAIMRLFDLGGRKAWAGAKQQIIDDNEFAKKRQQERLAAVKKLRENAKNK